MKALDKIYVFGTYLQFSRGYSINNNIAHLMKALGKNVLLLLMYSFQTKYSIT